MDNRPRLGALALAALLGSCGSGSDEGAAGSGASGAASAFVLEDVTAAAGLAGFSQENGNREKVHIPESVGAGVAFVDYDQDGDQDVYLTNGSSLEGFAPGEEPRDAMFRNDGDGTFTEVTADCGLGDIGWTCGVSVADVDNDGWPDLYLANFGPNVLYRNRGDGTFEDVTASAGVGDPRFSTCGTFLDHDGDGDLDLYVSNYVEFDPGYRPPDPKSCEYRGIMTMYGPRGLVGAKDRFYRNEGGLRFEDVTSEAGIDDPGHYGFQALAFDFDADGDQDVFVANDSNPNFLWRNEGDGTFRDVAYESGTALSESGKDQSCMGACLGDANGDGRVDLFVTNFSEDHCTLYRNEGDGFFVDVSFQAQLGHATYTTLGWGCAFEDFDNDGCFDLFVANGHVYPQVDEFDLGTSYRQVDQVFANRGGGRFVEVTEAAGLAGMAARCGRGAAFGDYDDDGDIDVLVGNLDDRPTLLRNDLAGAGRWIKVRLIGSASNRDAVGATILVEADGRRAVRSVGAGGSFLSSSDPRAHFGLGDARRVERVVVRWPGGAEETLRDLAPDRLYVVEEGRGVVRERELP